MSVRIKINRPTETVQLPSGASAEIETGTITAGDLIGLKQNVGDIEITFSMLANRIKSWTYINDETGEPLEVKADVIRYIPTEDYTTLMDKLKTVEGLTDEENLTSSAPSEGADNQTPNI